MISSDLLRRFESLLTDTGRMIGAMRLKRRRMVERTSRMKKEKHEVEVRKKGTENPSHTQGDEIMRVAKDLGVR